MLVCEDLLLKGGAPVMLLAKCGALAAALFAVATALCTMRLSRARARLSLAAGKHTNGEQGTIAGYKVCKYGSQPVIPIVRWLDGTISEVPPQSLAHSRLPRRVQVPLQLAWAMTIHKAHR